MLPGVPEIFNYTFNAVLPESFAVHFPDAAEVTVKIQPLDVSISSAGIPKK